MIAVILGGARGVWTQLNDLEAMLGRRPEIVVACNDAGAVYPGHLDGWATLHPEQFAAWRRKRSGNADYRRFSIKGHWDCGDLEIVPERWPGSSGLYAAQVALEEMGAAKAVLCGVPLEMDGRHFFTPSVQWADAENYRKGFEAAFPVICDSVRSMSGWTRELLGAPCSEWLTTGRLPEFNTKE